VTRNIIYIPIPRDAVRVTRNIVYITIPRDEVRVTKNEILFIPILNDVVRVTKNEILCIPIPRDTYTIRLGRAVQLIEASLHEAGGFGFDSRVGSLEIFKSPFLLFTFSSLGVHSASNGIEYKGIFFGGKVRPEPTADTFALLVEIRMEAQHFFLPLSLREFYRKAVPFFTIRTAVPLYMQNSFSHIDINSGMT